ncbi:MULTISPECIES: hypothetical protein, partial [unclassified Bartonella]|uniref:hypothetical protein n=1 Tax=unclassified Bartonella TaxID=2645622 RepID=UPI0035CF3F00
MKKKYSTQNLIKVVSLNTVMATLLSSVSPVFAANLSITGEIFRSTNSVNVMYPYGSHGSVVFSGDDDFCGADNVIGRGGKQQQGIADNRRITAEQQYNRFITDQEFNGRHPYGTTTEQVIWTGDGYTGSTNGKVLGAYIGGSTGGFTNALPEAYGAYSFATGCGSAATGNYSTVFGSGATAKAGGAQAFGVSALAGGIASIAMGVGSEASGKSSVAIGGLATALGTNSVALGTDAEALGAGAIAIGGRHFEKNTDNPIGKVIAYAENAIAIGTQAYAVTENSVAIGVNSKALVNDGVAVGRGSISDRDKNVAGYDPRLNGSSTETGIAWKSTTGAFSVGEVGGGGNGKLTRQITGVAAGSEDTDAVNVAQLKALRDLASGVWKLSANNTDPTDVNPGSTIDFSVKNSEVGKDNLKIAKNTAENKHKIEFTLSDTLKLTSVTTGQSSMSNEGFKFIDGNGPSITLNGIHAGDKKITGVAKGKEETDAVNKGQLDENITTLSKNIEDVRSVAVLYDEEEDLEDVNLPARSVRKVNKKSVTFGDPETSTVALHNVGKGKITNESHDGINGSQLFETNDKISTYLGGGAGYKDGKWSAPTFTVKTFDTDGEAKEETYQNVAAAFEGVNTALTTVQNKINNAIINVKGDSLVKWNEEAKLIKIGEEKEGTKIDITNKDGHNRILSGVAAGTSDTDAVNFSQLKTIKEQVEASSFVKQDAETKHITIGKDTDGDKIDIANNENEKRTLTGIKGGVLSADSNEAVIGSQLFETNDKVATYFGGGAKYENGQWIAPKFTVTTVKNDGNSEEKQYNTVAEALAGVGSSITNVKNDITKKINNEIANVKGDSFVKWDEDKQLIEIGAEKYGNKITISDNDGKSRTLSGVKEAEQDNDAVNKGQLDKGLKQLSESLQSDESAVIHYDKKEKGETDYTNITLGKGKGSTSVGLHNVADGMISESSHDAVTGGQINTIGEDIAKFLGGESSFKDGALTQPTYKLSEVSEEGKIKDKSYTGVGTAFSGLDENIKHVSQRIKEVSEGIAQDSLNWSSAEGAFLAQHGEKKGTKTNSKIKFLANGEVSEISSDAVNGSQLHSLGSSVAQYFGGGAEYKDGAWSAPNFKVKTVKDNGGSEEQEYKNVAEAFEGVGTSFANFQNKITNEISNQINHLQSDDSAVVHYDKKDKDEIDYTSVTLGKGKNSTPVGLHNVADGVMSESSHDAINGSQLFATNKKVINVTDNLSKVAENTSKYFGGSTDVLEGIEPAFLIQGKTHHNVFDAFTAINTSITNIDNKISKDIDTVTATAVLYDKDENGNVNYGSVTLGGGKSNGPVALLNVKDGAISQDSHDAINGSQINKISGDIANYFGGDAAFQDGAFVGPRYNLSQVSADGNVEQKTFENVGDALTGLDVNVKSVNQRLTNVSNEFNQKIEGITKDALLWDDEEGAFVARHEKDGQKTKSKLKYLLDGEIAEGSTDAITGNQLYLISNQLANYFGGGAKYGNGKWTDPTFKIVQVNADGTVGEEKNYNNVAEALGGVTGGMVNINNRINDVINNVDSDALKWNDKEKAYDAGRDGKPNKIINVADGKVEKGSKDAVNGGQLWETNER